MDDGKIINYTDMVVSHNIYEFNNKKYVFNKIKEFSKYELIVTDRLHGMIFSFLAKTPCLVLENQSYKIKGVYNWIKKCKSIKLCSNENIVAKYNEIKNIKFNDDSAYLRKEYKMLTNLILNNIGEQNGKFTNKEYK